MQSTDGQPLSLRPQDQCDARPAVTFPVAECPRPLTITKLHCLTTEAEGCKQLAHRRYWAASRPRVELARPLDC